MFRYVFGVPADHFCVLMDLFGAVQQKWHIVLFGILGTIFDHVKGHLFLKIKELLWMEMVSCIASELMSSPDSSSDLCCLCMHPHTRYIMLLSGIIASTVGLHLSRLIWMLSHPGMQKIWIIAFFFGNRLHWQFAVWLLQFTVCTCVNLSAMPDLKF